MPIAAHGSVLVLADGHERPIPRHRTSIVAAYARGWGWALSLGAFVGAAYLKAPWQVPAFVFSVFLFGGWLASFRLGAITRSEEQRRKVYAKVTGYLVDPGLLTHVNPSLSEHLGVDLATRAEALAPDGYRGRAGDWRAACDVTGVHPSILALALTLSRIGAARGDANDERLHARIWSRLAPLASSLPARIEPLTQISRAESVVRDASIPVVPSADADWESEPGRAIEAGWDVTIASAAALDPRCASCLAETNRTLQSIRTGIVARKSVAIPLCDRCIRHSYRADHGRGTLQLLAVTVAVTWGLLGIVPPLSLPVVLGLVFVLSMLTIVGLPFVAPPRRAVAPAHLAGTAARIVGARGNTMTLHCLNEEWARSVASRAGTTIRPKKRLFRGAIGGLALVPLFAPLVALVSYEVAHPSVRIDNGTGAPIHVYVDGEDEGIIAPGDDSPNLPKIEVSWGEHTFEWASTKSPQDRHKTTATIEFNGRHVWDPGKTHCYRVVATVYGKKTTVDESNIGPRPRAELYSFSQMQDWFVQSPAETKADGDGTVRYSLQRDPSCAAVSHCGKSAVDKYWDCMRVDDDPESCKALADELCDR